MLSLKGIRKYLIYACIAGWMFFIGIVVGRGTSPVTFDTREFSKKLEKMVNVPDPKKETGKKVDLKFYEDLDNPAAQERPAPKNPTPANPPEKETVKESPPEEEVKEPVKEVKKEPSKEPAAAKEPIKGIKKELIKKPARGIKKEPVKEPAKEEAKEPVKQSEKQSEKLPVKEPVKEAGPDQAGIETEEKKQKTDKGLKKEISPKGSYTIQIAAYKSFQEAVSQMAALKAKGFSSYRVKGEMDGITWYRVRIGPFETYHAAKEFKTGLDKAKIDSMIMKRESNEDIKE